MFNYKRVFMFVLAALILCLLLSTQTFATDLTIDQSQVSLSDSSAEQTTLSIMDGQIKFIYTDPIACYPDDESYVFGIETKGDVGSFIVKNDSDVMIWSFDWESQDATNILIDGKQSSTTKVTLYPGDEVSFSFEASVDFGYLTLKTFESEVSATSDVLFEYDESLGTVTVNGVFVANGTTVQIPSSGVTITAAPKDDSDFLGWVNPADHTFKTGSEIQNFSVSSGQTKVKAAFTAPSASAWFYTGNRTYLYDSLQAAIATASASNNKTVMLAASGMLDENTDYVIPEGINLLIPYYNNDAGVFNAASTYCERTSNTGKPFVTMTVPGTSSITVKSNAHMNVNAKQASMSGGVAGYINGDYGHVALEDGAELILENQASLTCYGYITGDGTVVAKTGSTVWELLQIADWRSGSFALEWVKQSKYRSVFMTSQYYVQNIESNFLMYPGAIEKFSTVLQLNIPLIGAIHFPAENEFIGPNGFINLTKGTLLRSYDFENERMTYTAQEEAVADIQGLTVEADLKGYGFWVGLGDSLTLDSTEYVLAINSNLSFVVKENSTINLKNDYKFLPESEVYVENGSTLNVDGNLYLYGISTWDGKGYVEGDDLHTVHYSAERYFQYGKGKGNRNITADSDSALMQIDGTLNINGAIYSNVGDPDNVISGSGVIDNKCNNAENFEKEIFELNSKNDLATVTFVPVRGILAGKSSSNIDPQPFNKGIYNNTGDLNGNEIVDDGDNYWYTHTITLTGEVDKIKAHKGSVINDSIAYCADGGVFRITLPYGYTAKINGVEIDYALAGGRMEFYTTITSDTTIDISGQDVEPNAKIAMVLNGSVVQEKPIYLPVGAEIYDYYTDTTCSTKYTDTFKGGEILYMSTTAKVTVNGIDTYFASLNDAFEEVSAGAVVTIIDDIEVNKTITIPNGIEVIVNVNGKTVSYASTLFNVYGKLNMDLSGGIVKNCITDMGPSEFSAIIVWPKGEFNLEMNGGTLTWAVDADYITNNNYAFNASGVVAPVRTYDGSTTNIDMTNGTLSVDHNMGMKSCGLHAIYNQGYMNITGSGTIIGNAYTATSASKFQDPATDKLVTASVLVNYGGTMNITNGVEMIATQVNQLFSATLVNGWSGTLTLDNVSFTGHYGVAVANTAGTIEDVNNVTIIGGKNANGKVDRGYGIFNYSDNEGSFKGTGVIEQIRGNTVIDVQNYAIRGEEDSVFGTIGGSGTQNFTSYDASKYSVYLNGCIVENIGSDSGTMNIKSANIGIYVTNGAVVNNIGGNVNVDGTTYGILVEKSKAGVDEAGETVAIYSEIKHLGTENSIVNVTAKTYGIVISSGAKIDTIGSTGAVVNIKSTNLSSSYGVSVASGSSLNTLGAEGVVNIEAKNAIHVKGTDNETKSIINAIGGSGSVNILAERYGVYALSDSQIGTISGDVGVLAREDAVYVDASSTIGSIGDGVKLTGHKNSVNNAGTIISISDAVMISLGTAENFTVLNTGAIGIKGGYYYHLLGRDQIFSGATCAEGFSLSNTLKTAPDTMTDCYFVTTTLCGSCTDNDADHLCDICDSKLSEHNYTVNNGIRTCSICGYEDFHTYRWEKDSTGKLISVGVNDNDPTWNSAGYYTITPFDLEADEEWAIEWKMKADSTNGRMLFSQTFNGADSNNNFLFIRNVANYVGFGHLVGSSYNNYGAYCGNIKLTDKHTYRLENRIYPDGSNIIYLIADGIDVGPVTRHYVGGTDQNGYSNWPGSQDKFSVHYIGTSDFGLVGDDIDYISVSLTAPCTHEYEVTEEREATCTTTGGTVYTCTLCGQSYIEAIDRLTGHNFGNDFKCIDCGEVAKVSILGDSISTYTGVSNNPDYNETLKGASVYYSGSNYSVQRKDTWWQQTIDLLELELCVNNSWSGSAIFGTRSGTVGAYKNRCVQLHNDKTGEEPDIILVFLGTNDFSYTIEGEDFAHLDLGLDKDIDYNTLIQLEEDGSFTYATPTTSAEAYAIMLHKMQQRYPDAEIYCMSLMTRRNPVYSKKDVGQPTEFNACLKSVVDYFELNYIEMEGLFSSDPAEFDLYNGDKRVHPNKDGMDLMTQAVAEALLNKDVYFVKNTLNDVTTNNTAEFAVSGESYNAKLTHGAGSTSTKVKVTMGGKDITDTAYSAETGNVNIATISGDVDIIAEGVLNTDELNFEWIFDNESKNLVSSGVNVNAVKREDTTGTVDSDGTFNGVYYSLSKPVQLLNDKEWYIEWISTNKNESKAMLFTSDEKGSNAADGARYLFKANGGLLAFGELNSGIQNYGIHLTNAESDGGIGVDITQRLVYRIENRIEPDGSNMAYLKINGVDYGPMVNHYVAQTNKNTTSDWFNGKDFVFSYIGSSSHPLTKMSIESLEVHYHVYGEWVHKEGDTYIRTCSDCGDEISREFTYLWTKDATNGLKSSGVVENKLDKIGGTVTSSGAFQNVQYDIEKPVILNRKENWEIEWRMTGDWTGMLFSSSKDAGTTGMKLLFKTISSSSDLLALGQYTTSYENSGYELANVIKGNWSVPHTYQIKNVVAEDSSNTVTLYVDGKLAGEMNNYFKGSNDQSTTTDWLNTNEQFVFEYIGADGYAVNASDIEYIAVHAQHVHSYGQWTHVQDDNYERSCACGEKETAQFDYLWQCTNNEFVPVAEDNNVLTDKKGSINNGKFTGVSYKLAEAIELKPDEEWSIEWKAAGDWDGMLFSNNPKGNVDGNTYLMKTYNHTANYNGLLAFGKKISNTYDNYGYDLPVEQWNMKEPHVYRLENRIAEDNTNAIWLVVDGQYSYQMNHNYSGSTSYKGVNNWASSQTFTFAYIGSEGFELKNMSLEYLAVNASMHEHNYTSSVTTAATCTNAGVRTYKCSACGDNYTEDIEKLSHTMAATDAKESTCTVAGNTAYWYCEPCGKYFNDEAGSEEIQKDSWVLATKDHNYVKGTCTVCGGADPNAPTGTTVIGTIKAYNAKNVPVVKLYVDGVEKYAAEIGEAVASGTQYTWSFNFDAVEKGTYDLVIVKDGHLTYTITDVQVDNEPVDLNEHSDAKIRTISMLCGDINGDGSINPTDINVIYQSGNYYKSVDVATNPIADLNGDGSINPTDINIIYQSAHYYKGVADCTVAY